VDEEVRLRFIAVLLFAAIAFSAVAADAPSRDALDNCRWKKISEAKLGLAAWVQECDYGFRKIDFVVQDHALAERFSDGGEPGPVIRLFDLRPRETAEAGLRRIFAAETDPAVAKRCVLAPYEPASKRRDVKRYTFVPDAAYRKELDAKQEDGIPEPPCGELGEAPDFIQYFEVQPKSGARRVMLVILGQDTPLFDEETLRLLAD
jgi:hypothetical protein